MEKIFDPELVWRDMDPVVAHSAIDALASSRDIVVSEFSLQSARTAGLKPFIRHQLIELDVKRGAWSGRLYALHDTVSVSWLDGSPSSIYAAIEDESITLKPENALGYLRFFMFALRSNGSAFVLIESPNDYRADAASAEVLSTLQRVARPLTLTSSSEVGPWTVGATVAHNGSVFNVNLEVSSSGIVQMTGDECVLDHVAGVDLPSYPLLGFQQLGLPEISAKATKADSDSTGDEIAKGTESSYMTGATHQARISGAFVEVLLSDALDNQAGHSLYRRFNERAVASSPIDRFAEFLFTSWPIAIIEGGYPFVEEVVADAARRRHEMGGQVSIVAADYIDASTCHVPPNVKAMSIVVIPMHVYDKVQDVDRVAHDLSMRDIAVLIGCERAADVPQPLRQIADISLQLPPIDARRFCAIFELIVGNSCPALPADCGWVRYVAPSDFQPVLQLGLEPRDAVHYIRERVQARLTEVDPNLGPGLNDLHGMGDSMQIAKDLIADIGAAQLGQIPWTNVDRGMLLVGQPGTGKTTLARAIAKECGVKFINASAARWQASGYLDSHLRAIHADFTTARRYAPAILFIDEIDSIGSRESLTGSNAVYQTDVINALLEEINGFDSGSPIIVIAATNYPDKVDPALRRAGRLDRTVSIPYPSIQSLVEIYRYYLKQYADAGSLDSDIDLQDLSELSFGCTGADVDLFVRGAARRARKGSRSILQRDLIDEITGKPRDAETTTRLSPEEILRVAVHESGHALATLLGSSRGRRLSFASIVPRQNGTLGFVASAPDSAACVTRGEMLERLEVILAGRAAEEVVFGKGSVSGGAGGASVSADLAVATRLVRSLVAQYGFGLKGNLRWTDVTLPEQEQEVEQILRQCYRSTIAKLKTARLVLDRITKEFLKYQELSGAHLRKLFEEEMKGIVTPEVTKKSRKADKTSGQRNT